MLQQTFISVVMVLHTHRDVEGISPALDAVCQQLASAFTHWEVVLVNNHCDQAVIKQKIAPLPEALRKNIYQLNLSTPVDRNNAFLAGLDRANGDYTVLLEQEFTEMPDLLERMYAATQAGADMVYLRGRKSRFSLLNSVFYGIFYWIIKRYSHLKIDDSAFLTRMVSRRALNSVLRLRENALYLKALFAMVGYNTAALDVPKDVMTEAGGNLQQQFRTSLVAITSFTTFLRSLLLWIFVGALGFTIFILIDALKVKFTGYNCFGTYHEVVSGWTYLVVLMSSFFTITCLMLYIMSIYLSNIYSELKARPPYIIESVYRY